MLNLLSTQFAGCSRKYFGTYHAELNTKPKRDPVWELYE